MEFSLEYVSNYFHRTQYSNADQTMEEFNPLTIHKGFDLLYRPYTYSIYLARIHAYICVLKINYYQVE